jgi:hypothetical protein
MRKQQTSIQLAIMYAHVIENASVYSLTDVIPELAVTW